MVLVLSFHLASDFQDELSALWKEICTSYDASLFRLLGIHVVSTFRWPGKSARQYGTSKRQLRTATRNCQKLEQTRREPFSNTRLQCSNCVQRNNAKRHVEGHFSGVYCSALVHRGTKHCVLCMCQMPRKSREHKSHSACRTSHLHQLRRNLRSGQIFHFGTSHLNPKLLPLDLPRSPNAQNGQVTSLFKFLVVLLVWSIYFHRQKCYGLSRDVTRQIRLSANRVW